MNKYPKTILIFLFLIIFSFFVFNFIQQIKQSRNPVLKDSDGILGQSSEEVDITGYVKMTEINLKLYPEKRHPDTNNWQTYIDVEVQDNTTHDTVLSRNSISMNFLGEGTIYLVSGENIEVGTYSILLKASSHLSQRYNNLIFDQTVESFDFTPYEDSIAGDTHDSFDNFINSLDVSTLLGKLNTNDYISDLNQDSIVNSLDLSNQLYNLSLSGDV